MTQKVPPPPSIASGNIQDFIRQLPALNRWFLELTSILEAGGSIAPDTIPGYTDLQTQVNALSGTVGSQAATISTLQFQVGLLTASLAAANASITTLNARAQVFNGATGAGAPSNGIGTDNDWFYNRTGAAGNRLFIKLGGVWVAQAI